MCSDHQDLCLIYTLSFQEYRFLPIPWCSYRKSTTKILLTLTDFLFPFCTKINLQGNYHKRSAKFLQKFHRVSGCLKVPGIVAVSLSTFFVEIVSFLVRVEAQTNTIKRRKRKKVSILIRFSWTRANFSFFKSLWLRRWWQNVYPFCFRLPHSFTSLFYRRLLKLFLVS